MLEELNFYKGYEGEPEIHIVPGKDSEGLYTVHMWIGYFDSIMNRIPPNTNGSWEGAAEYYLTNGWDADDDWEYQDVNGYLEQIKRIDTSVLDNTLKEIKSKIEELLEKCVEVDCSIKFQYK